MGQCDVIGLHAHDALNWLFKAPHIFFIFLMKWYLQYKIYPVI